MKVQARQASKASQALAQLDASSVAFVPFTCQHWKSAPGRSQPLSGPMSCGGVSRELSVLAGRTDADTGRPALARRRSMIARPAGGADMFSPMSANSLGDAVLSLAIIRSPTPAGGRRAPPPAELNAGTLKVALTSNWLERNGSRCSAVSPAAAVSVADTHSVLPLPLSRRDCSSGTGACSSMTPQSS